MFGQNEIVGRQYFKDAGDRLMVTSMFMTLQGEGPLRGEPAFFVRLSKCNLACGFCDTAFDHGEFYTLEELDRMIYGAIVRHYNGDVPPWARYHEGYESATPKVSGRTVASLAGKYFVQAEPRKMALVITGGEPLLQTNIVPFIQEQRFKFQKVQVETNGTVPIAWVDGLIVVCSPKASEKHGKPTQYLKPHQSVLERADCLKFVMQAPQNSPSPYESVPDWALQWRENTGRPIFVSPMNVYNRAPMKRSDGLLGRTADEVVSFWDPGLLNMQENERNHKHAAQYCVQHGLTLNLQIHLYAGLA